MNRRKKIIVFFISILCILAAGSGILFIGRKSNPYIKSDKIVYETDSIEVVHRASKELDKRGKLYLLGQMGMGSLKAADPDRDAFVLKTSVDTGKSIELYEQKEEKLRYKPDGWFLHYATYQESMLCADYISEEATFGKPTPCLAVINLETKKEKIWNLSELSGKPVFTEEGEAVNKLVWLSKKEVAVLAGNKILRINIKNGKLSEYSQIAESPFINWNLSGTVLSYVIKKENRYLFEAVELREMKKLASIDAGTWKEGFGEYDILYCDGEIYKIDKKNLYRYSYKKNQFQKIYSGIKMQETTVDPNTGEAYYNYCRLYGTDRHCLYVMHVSEYAGECNFCRIHKLETSTAVFQKNRKTGKETTQHRKVGQDTVNEEKKDAKKEQEATGKLAEYIDNGVDALQTGYFYQQKKGGRIEKFTYQTRNYAGGDEVYDKNAMIYLPAGYDPANQDKKYDIFYLMHGGGDDEQWYFGDGEGEYDTDLKCILDHMIANGDIPPCIVCTPTYQNPYCANEKESLEYFCQEFRKDLIPAVEGKYHTYYDPSSMSDSRWHRSFGGFSMGAATTWWIFEQCMDLVAKFMPVSGDSWCGGGTGEKKVLHLSEAVKKQGYTEKDFLLFYGCGGESDIAYHNVTSQVKAMKAGNGVFRYCSNFTEGNFYYAEIKLGGHDITTVCTVVYNGLLRMLGSPRTGQRYYQWAEGIMVNKEPEQAAKRDSQYYYGKWKKCQYYSRTAKRQTNVNILLPPNYSKEETYPVLYLLHGYYDDENWMTGEPMELKKILGNLINYGKAREMIVVAPYIFCSPEKETCTEMNLENSLCYDNFVNDLLADLKPFIEKKFSVKKGRENTAIAGFSMGGREAAYIGIKHADLFGYVGAVCPAPGLTPGSDLGQHPGQLKENELVFPDGREPYLFLLSAAKEDPAVGKNPFMLHSLLEKNHVNHLWNIIPDGGHDAASVRVHLYNYLRMIFRYMS